MWNKQVTFRLTFSLFTVSRWLPTCRCGTTWPCRHLLGTSWWGWDEGRAGGRRACHAEGTSGFLTRLSNPWGRQQQLIWMIKAALINISILIMDEMTMWGERGHSQWWSCRELRPTLQFLWSVRSILMSFSLLFWFCSPTVLLFCLLSSSSFQWKSSDKPDSSPPAQH